MTRLAKLPNIRRDDDHRISMDQIRSLMYKSHGLGAT